MNRSIALRAAASACVLVTTAHAEEPTAADVAGAPPPGEESGRIDDVDDGDSMLRHVGRGMLVVPRMAFELAVSPVRVGVWAYDKYKLRDRWLHVFFNDAQTIGLYPVLSYDAGFGAAGGARFVARDLFGKREHAAVRVGYGGRYDLLARGTLRTGHRLGRASFELGAEYEQRPHDRFYGIGNGDLQTSTDMIDPLATDTAVATRYRQELMRASLVFDLALVSNLHLRTAGALTELSFGASETGTSIEQAYMTDQLVGFDGTRYGYGDVELAWDSRRHYTRWEPPSIPSVGWLAAVYAGRFAVEDGADFWRFGGDAQHLWRVGSGPRVIATRLHVETVSAPVDEVPFDELPKLGGRYLLRGYPTDRFRDRAAALATVEYRWDLSKYVHANLFVDVGTVAPSVTGLADETMRVGYGVGLDAYTERSFLMRATLESSPEGEVFLNVLFDPAFELDPRVERR